MSETLNALHHPPPIRFYLAGSAEPFLEIRPELCPKLGRILGQLVHDWFRMGLQVRTHPEIVEEQP